MTYQAKATHISLMLHAAIVLGILLFSCYSIPKPPLLIIDFSIVAAEAAAGEQEKPPGSAQQNHVSPPTPSAQTEPVVQKKVVPGKPVKEPQKIKKKNALQPKKARDMVRKEAQPAVEKSAEPAALPLIQERPAESSEVMTTGESQPDRASNDGAITAAGAVASIGGKSGRNGQQTGGGNTRYNFEYVRNLILKNLTFPSAAQKMGLTGKIVVSFLLKEDGYVENISVVSGSGYEILDSNVVATIGRIAPFPKPPAQAQLILPIVYNLK